MKTIVCITCPNGCELTIEENTLEVSGNKCPKGKEFAINELTNPKRSICSSVKTIYKDVPVVSVKVNNDIPKDKIFEVIKEINKVVLSEKSGIGEVVIKNVLGLDADVVITSNILKENTDEK